VDYWLEVERHSSQHEGFFCTKKNINTIVSASCWLEVESHSSQREGFLFTKANINIGVYHGLSIRSQKGVHLSTKVVFALRQTSALAYSASCWLEVVRHSSQHKGCLCIREKHSH